MSKAYGYCRYSIERPGKKKLPGEEMNSITVQKEMISKYYEYALKPKGVEFGGFFVDEAVSGNKTILSEREQGRSLCKILQEGDHFIAAKMDRAFRRAKDCVIMMDRWKDDGITLHVLDLHIDTSTPFGRFFLTIMAAMAEWERSRLVERISTGLREAIAKRKAEGKPWGFVPYGYMSVGPMWGKYHIPAVKERRIMATIYGWYKEGFTIQEIRWACARQGVLFRGRELGDGRIKSIIRAERWFREGYDPYKNPHPNGALLKPGELDATTEKDQS